MPKNEEDHSVLDGEPESEIQGSEASQKKDDILSSKSSNESLCDGEAESGSPSDSQESKALSSDEESLTKQFDKIRLSDKASDEKNDRSRSYSGGDLIEKETTSLRLRASSGEAQVSTSPLVVTETKGPVNHDSSQSGQSRIGVSNSSHAIRRSRAQQARNGLIAADSNQSFPIQICIEGIEVTIGRNTSLHKMAFDNDINGFKQGVCFCRMNGRTELLNEKNSLEQTPLFIFVLQNSTEGLLFAISSGMDPNIRGRTLVSSNGKVLKSLLYPPLLIAARSGNIKLLKELLARGNTQSATGRTRILLDQCIEDSDTKEEGGLTTLADIVVSERMDLIPVVEILVQQGADPFCTFKTSFHHKGSAMALALMYPRRFPFAEAMFRALTNIGTELTKLNSLVKIGYPSYQKEGFYLDIAKFGLHQNLDQNIDRQFTEKFMNQLEEYYKARTVSEHASRYYPFGIQDPPPSIKSPVSDYASDASYSPVSAPMNSPDPSSPPHRIIGMDQYMPNIESPPYVPGPAAPIPGSSWAQEPVPVPVPSKVYSPVAPYRPPSLQQNLYHMAPQPQEVQPAQGQNVVLKVEGQQVVCAIDDSGLSNLLDIINDPAPPVREDNGQAALIDDHRYGTIPLGDVEQTVESLLSPTQKEKEGER